MAKFETARFFEEKLWVERRAPALAGGTQPLFSALGGGTRLFFIALTGGTRAPGRGGESGGFDDFRRGKDYANLL